MTCNTPNSPASSLIGELMLSASVLSALTPQASYGQVKEAYDHYKELL